MKTSATALALLGTFAMAAAGESPESSKMSEMSSYNDISCPNSCPDGLVAMGKKCSDHNECGIFGKDHCNLTINLPTCKDVDGENDTKEYQVKGMCMNLDATMEDGLAYKCVYDHTVVVSVCAVDNDMDLPSADAGNMDGKRALRSVGGDGEIVAGANRLVTMASSAAIEKYGDHSTVCAEGYESVIDHQTNAVVCKGGASAERRSLTDKTQDSCRSTCPKGQFPTKCVCPWQESKTSPETFCMGIVHDNKFEIKKAFPGWENDSPSINVLLDGDYANAEGEKCTVYGTTNHCKDSLDYVHSCDWKCNPYSIDLDWPHTEQDGGLCKLKGLKNEKDGSSKE